MSARPRVLILSYTETAREPRLLKQVAFLREHADVVTAGFGDAPFTDLEHVRLHNAAPYRGGAMARLGYVVAMATRRFAHITSRNERDRKARASIGARSWDVIIAHDPQTVVLARSLAPAALIVDLHEYSPRQNEHSLVWRALVAPYVRWLCRTQVTAADHVVTVGQGIADEYRREFGIESDVIVNASPYAELTPTPVASPLRLVHSGVAGVQRRLDIMIDAVLQTSADVTLDLYLVDPESSAVEALRARAARSDRVRFHPPVPYRDLVPTLNAYDVGVALFPPTTFNLAWCLPNKFFDFVQARLAIVTGPSPEMRRIIDRDGLGVVADDFTVDALATALAALTPEQVGSAKQAAHRHAHDLSADAQAEFWPALVGRLMDGRSA